MKIGSARNLMMFNFTGLSFLVHVAERHRRAGWVLGCHPYRLPRPLSMTKTPMLLAKGECYWCCILRTKMDDPARQRENDLPKRPPATS